jgi:tetratricopeptide (TPR) repeat protein
MRTLACFAVLVGSSVVAQPLAAYNRGLGSYNGGNFDEAVKAFYEVYTTTSDAEVELRQKSEYYLAASFQRMNLPFSANIYHAAIVKAGPSHPFHLKSVEALVSLQEVLEDDQLIPSIIERNYDKFADAWATLPVEVLARINYLIGRISHRKTKMEEAKGFFEAVPSDSGIYHKAQYMLGLTLADPRYPAADEAAKKANLQKALEVWTALLKYRPPNRKDLEATHQLATLGLGRVNYNLGEYDRSVEWYEKIPRFSKYWDQSLFENGFARFQADDYGGGLGSLQALHAPQFTGAFQPESWLLKSTIYYFRCLYDEGKAALNEFESIYPPMAEKLKPAVEHDANDFAYFFQLVESGNEIVPKPILNTVRVNERMLNFFALIKQIDKEKQLANDNAGWKALKLSPELTTYLDQNRALVEQLGGREARKELISAARTVKGFADQAEIIRFEISKAEKEFFEKGTNQKKLLANQALYRPQMPAENWNYWKFQGEFWRDEIGYYQYTLKNGCAE